MTATDAFRFFGALPTGGGAVQQSALSYSLRQLTERDAAGFAGDGILTEGEIALDAVDAPDDGISFGMNRGARENREAARSAPKAGLRPTKAG